VGELVLPNRNIVRAVVEGPLKYVSAQRWLPPESRPAAVLQDSAGGQLEFALWAPPVRFELFDLIRDPHEQHDLAGARPAAVSQMRAALAAFASRCPGGDAGKTKTGALSEEQAESLRALGYIQ
jgi:hypothetical protein